MPNPAVPIEQKRITGNPGQRKLPDPDEIASVDGGYREPHRELGEAGKMLWDRAYSVGKPWVASTDTELLLLTCKQLDRSIELERLWKITPEDFHMHRQLLELEKAIVINLGLLGMTVDARAKLGLAEIKAKSLYEEMMSERV